MPDTVNIEFDIFGDPITVSGDITPQDVENGRTLAAEVSALLLFIFIYGWFDRSGRRISDSTIRKLIDKLVQVAGVRIKRVTEQMIAGKVPVDVWQLRMRNILRAGYTVSSVANRGGLRNMTLSDWDYISQWSARHMNYLNRFARQLIDPDYSVTAQAILRRSMSYATAIRSIGNNMILNGLAAHNYHPGGAYRVLLRTGKALQRLDEDLLELRHYLKLNPGEAAERQLARQARKMDALVRSANAQAQRVAGSRYEVKRVLGVAEHCEGCIFWAERWMPPEVMPPLGTQECMSHCKCHLEARLVGATPAAREASRSYVQPPTITVRL